MIPTGIASSMIPTEIPMGIRTAIASSMMRKVVIADFAAGDVDWGSDKPVVVRRVEGSLDVMAKIIAEPDGVSHGQLFVTVDGKRYTVAIGGHLLYYMNTAKNRIDAHEIMSVTDSTITALYEKTKDIWPFLSSRYIKSISSQYIRHLVRLERSITIFHAGFPDVRPAIIPLDKFVIRADAPMVRDSDGRWHVRVDVALTSRDVKLIQKMLCGNQVNIMLDDVSQTVVKLFENWGVKYNIEYRVDAN